MRKTRFKNMFLLTALAMALLFLGGTGYASTVYITGPTEVQGQFSFDVMIGDIGELSNLDEWSLGLVLDPEANATFVSAADVSGDTDYVFYGDSWDYDSTLNDYQIMVGDLTAAGDGSHTDILVPGMLLATITVDVSSAEVCEWYSIGLYDSGWSYFGDVEGTYESLSLPGGEYDFHVVPIPGTLLLLGSGLLGFIVLSRRKKMP